MVPARGQTLLRSYLPVKSSAGLSRTDRKGVYGAIRAELAADRPTLLAELAKPVTMSRARRAWPEITK